MGRELVDFPFCHHEGHGRMEQRPLAFQTQEQKWCGAWFDCMHPGCSCSVLIPSPEVMKMHGIKEDGR